MRNKTHFGINLDEYLLFIKHREKSVHHHHNEPLLLLVIRVATCMKNILKDIFMYFYCFQLFFLISYNVFTVHRKPAGNEMC